MPKHKYYGKKTMKYIRGDYKIICPRCGGINCTRYLVGGLIDCNDCGNYFTFSERGDILDFILGLRDRREKQDNQ